MGLWLVFVALAVPLFLSLKQELAPIEDRGIIFGIVSAPEGSTVAYTSSYVQKIEDIYKEIPEMVRYNSIVGFPTVSDGRVILRLKDWNERTRSQQEIARELMPQFRNLAGRECVCRQPGVARTGTRQAAAIHHHDLGTL